MANSPTVIGSTIKINGKLSAEEDVSILGRVEGEIETSADLYVEISGTIEAEVSTRNIDVHGKIVGNTTARDRFEIHAGGTVNGDIRAPRVIMEDGANYSGNVDMGKKG